MSRKEEDIRADRFESEIRTDDMENISRRVKEGSRQRVYQCSSCHRLFEEKSLHCPKCCTKTMGFLIQAKG